MARVKRGVAAKKRHKKVLKQAKGYYGNKSRSFRAANEQVMHSGQYAFRDRRAKKGEFRRLWIQRINAACRQNDMSYSRFVAGLNAADAVKQPRKTLFTAVGYGTEVRQADTGSQKPTPMSYPIIRRYVEMPGQKITPQIIQTNGNENDPFGTGGTCFGDSGGSLWLDGKVVGVTSYGYTQNCRYLDGYQRIDIPGVASWLAGFLG